MKSLVALVALCTLSFVSPAKAQITQSSQGICAINIVQGIDSELTSLVMSSVRRTCQKNWRLEIILASEGGNLYQAITLYEFLRSWPGGVTIHGTHVESAAVIIFMAGDIRTLTSSSRIMMHKPRMEISDGTYDSEELREMIEGLRLGRITMGRIISERTNNDLSTVLTMLDQSTFLTAEDAVRLGFAHRLSSPSH